MQHLTTVGDAGEKRTNFFGSECKVHNVLIPTIVAGWPKFEPSLVVLRRFKVNRNRTFLEQNFISTLPSKVREEFKQSRTPQLRLIMSCIASKSSGNVNALERESRFNLGPNTAKKWRLYRKYSEEKLFGIKLPTKNSAADTYLYLPQRWK